MFTLSIIKIGGQYQYKFQAPKTPEVYQMDKYGNPEISLYTGRPNINVPLYSIEYGDIKVPLQLSYSSNGIRADEESSRVGLGWYMETPMITQIVNGYDDLTLPIVRTKYYYNYKPSFLVDPQPGWWYQYRTSNPGIATGNVIERLNISNSMISDPTLHLNEGFIGKLSSDGGGNLLHMGTYLPINNQLQSHYFVPLNQSPTIGYDFDVELDFFKASFYGHEITFYKLPNQNLYYVLDKKGYKVSMTKIDNYHFSWVITTPAGDKYTFGQQTVAMSESPNPQNKVPYLDVATPNNTPTYSLASMPGVPNYPYSISNRSWYLSLIQDVNNNSIVYNYKQLQSVKVENQYSTGKCRFMNTFSRTVDQQYYPGNYEQLDNIVGSGDIPSSTGDYIYCDKSSNTSFQENIILDKITFGNSQIEFTTSSRTDKIYDERLESIFVRNNGRKIKTIDFNVSYYPETHVLSKRMKLNSVKIDDREYKFEYNSATLATKYSDYWGYFNGLSNSTPYTNPFRLFKDTNTIPTWAQSIYNQTKDTENKSAHPENIKIGILEKIIYPTGGYTQYEYELNTFDNIFFPNYDNKVTLKKNNFSINHLNIDTNFSNRSTQSFTVTNGDIINGTISLTNGISGICPYSNSSFKMVKIPTDRIAQYNSGVSGRESFWYEVDNGYITVETIYTKTGFTSLNDVNFSVNITADAVVAARVKFDTACPSTGSPKGSITANFGSKIFKDYQQSYSSGYGLRVKKTTDYNENGIQIVNDYTYSGGKHISPFRPVTDEELYNAYYLIKNTQPQVYYTRYAIQSHQLTSSNVSFFQTNVLGNGDFVGYDKVEVHTKNNTNTSKGKEVHYFTNTPDVEPSEKFGNADGTSKSEMNLFGRGFRKSDTLNGKERLVEFYNSDNSLLKRIKNIYTPSLIYDKDGKTCYNIAVRNIRTEGAVLGGSALGGSGNDGTLLHTFDRTNLYYYPLKGSETLLTSSTVSEFLSNNELKTKTNYTYNGFNLVNSKSILTPSADQISENYSYSSNISKLLLANILTTNISKSIFKNSKLIYSENKQYNDTNHLNPTSINTTNIQNNTTTLEVTFDKYDSNGHLQQYTTKDGIPVAIIWGYNNTQPIAKIEGAKLTDISQSLIDSIVNASNTDAQASAGNDETSFLALLDSFRLNLASYLTTTYTYDPLIGVRSITPPSGIRESYLYDSAGRLEKIVDANGKVLKEMKYNYKN